jgi:hypothetical protein
MEGANNSGKEVLDRSTKKFLVDGMQEQQDLLIQEREGNLQLFTQDSRDSLPRDLSSKLDRI